MKTLILLLLSTAAFGQAALPDAPAPQAKAESPIALRDRGFFAVRRPGEPALATNRQLLKPSFLVPHLAAIVASVANVTRARKAGAGYWDAGISVGAVSVLDVLTFKYISKPVGDGPAAYITAVRAYGAVTKTYY